MPTVITRLSILSASIGLGRIITIIIWRIFQISLSPNDTPFIVRGISRPINLILRIWKQLTIFILIDSTIGQNLLTTDNEIIAYNIISFFSGQ